MEMGAAAHRRIFLSVSLQFYARSWVPRRDGPRGSIMIDSSGNPLAYCIRFAEEDRWLSFECALHSVVREVCDGFGDLN